MTDVNADADPVLPLPAWPITDDAIRDVFAAMLQDGSWGRYHGPHCEKLIAALAEFHSVNHVVLCSSGTCAVELSLRAAGVEPDDEVILAAYDYKANFVNVLTLGATPVLVDTLPGVPVLDPSKLAAAITPQTRAIICSHLHGSFAAIDDVLTVAKPHQIVVVEDACQAVGGVLNGRAAGSIGDLGVLSFGGSKLLTAGRGGAILTNNATLAQRIRLYTQRGNDAYPLSEMQAAVLVPQLQQLPQRTAFRLANVRLLLEHLSGSQRLVAALNPAPWGSADTTPAFYKLAFRFRPWDQNGENGVDRREFTDALRQQGVPLDPAFPGLHRIHSPRRFRVSGHLTQADLLHDCLMTLHHPVLLADAAQTITDLAAVMAEWKNSATKS